ncbi:zinc finger BED domain-containing protein RICESLEEPER 2-like [Prosopis cineraria]|uniref:zinc finger BED domain-containing protein RICESLEEPER 2-like n=1 Tax=Prosopis cineraria TaxID=364024 RepID=UPI00241075C1|nr:zinc finger BED domain-containing protein RICESLEEPER 2-like [Prosopis cineraria]
MSASQSHKSKSKATNVSSNDLAKCDDRTLIKSGMVPSLAAGIVQEAEDVQVDDELKAKRSRGYICLTAHFVDERWKLYSKILSFCKMKPPHSRIELARKVHECLTDWGIENRIFSITLDNASANDNMQDILKERLSLQDDFKLVSNGEFFHVRCCAHILNLIVQEGLKVTSSALHKIRESIKFVKASEARSILFKQCVEQVGSIDTSMGLRLDVPTRWNSTYTMLESGIEYRRAFTHIAINDTNYKFSLTNDEWARADAMCSFLRPFEKIIRLISGSSYPISNSCFMQISKIEMLLDANMKSPDLVIQEMARKMKQKFDKYWNKYSVILALAVVFNPRGKFYIIQYCYTKIDPFTCHEKVANIKSKLIFMFNEYSSMGTFTNLGVDGAASGSSYKALTVTTHHSALASSVST